MNKSLLTILAPAADIAAKAETEGKALKKGKNFPWRTVISFAVYLVLIPLVIFIGVKLLGNRKYNLISIIIAFLSCVPFFIGYEKGKIGARE